MHRHDGAHGIQREHVVFIIYLDLAPMLSLTCIGK